MYISRIKIQNYRGIAEMQDYIELGNLSTFVGRNDIGKSTVINALACFFDTSATAKLNSNDFNHNTDDNIEIECIFTNVGESLGAYYQDTKKKSDGIETCTKYTLIDSDLYIRKTYDRQKLSGKFEIKLNEYERFEGLLDKKSTELDKLMKSNSLTAENSSVGRNPDTLKIESIIKHCEVNNIRKVEKWTEDKDIAKILPNFELFKADYSLEIKDNFDNKFGAEIKQVLEESKKSLDQISNDINEVLRLEAIGISNFLKEYVSDLDGLDIKVSPVWYDAVKKVTVNLKAKNDTQPVSIENKGTGYRRLLMVARLRYLATKNDKTNTIYAIEEPETYLHPKAQEQLLEALKTISENHQVLLTTHSTIFAGSTEIDNLILVTKENDNSKYDQKSENKIKNIIIELGVKPTHNLYDSKDYEGILFVEGNSDEFFVKEAMRKLGFEELVEKIGFVFGGGESLDYFVNLEYWKGNNRKLFSIIDSDIYFVGDPCINNEQKISLDRKKTKNNEFITNFNSNYGNAWMLKKRNIENYYQPNAILREITKLNTNTLITLESVTFLDTDNVSDKLKKLKASNSNITGLETKGNKNIFESMTKEEWVNVSGGQLEEIFEAIKTQLVDNND